MKAPSSQPRVLLIVLSSFFVLPCSLFPQGSLTPPGAPAPTMKTLDQVEARTAIDPNQPGFAFPYTISTPGSYYLAANLAVTGGNAIVIGVSNVTLDLNGFTISSSASPAGGTAIAPGGFLTDMAILNGHIAGSFQHGIRYSGAISQLKNVRVEGISVSGCSGDGINLSNFSSIVIDHCTVQQIGAQGIVGGSVNNSVAENCGSTGITAKSATNCVGGCSASGRGVYAKTAVNCVGTSATGTGLDADSATGCRGESTAIGSTGTGLNAVTATGCYGSNSSGSGTGLSATSANGCYGFSAGSATGLSAIIANNCYGVSISARGLDSMVATSCYGSCNSIFNGLRATSIASNCYGFSNGGDAIQAYIAVTCLGETSPPNGNSVIANFKYNMPP